MRSSALGRYLPIASDNRRPEASTELILWVSRRFGVEKPSKPTIDSSFSIALPSQKRQARRLADNGLEKPPLRHRQHRGPRHDEVIQQPDVDQRQRLLQVPGQRNIRLAGFG